MKKFMRNNRVIAITFLIVLTTGIIPVATASDSNRVKPVVPVEMKFIGKQNDKPVFQLIFNGTSEQNDFTITVRDQYDEVLYRENFRAEVFSKKFLLNTDELGDVTLLFEIHSHKTNQRVTYLVNRDTRQVEDIEIRKL